MDTIKHASVFDASKVRGTIAVVGVGALGSAVAIQLAKLGISRMVLIDHDRIEDHNIPNQILYGPQDEGRFKVEAAADAIERLTGAQVHTSARKLESRTLLRNFGVSHVFICVDSMDVRKALFRSCVFLNPEIVYYNEGRMSARQGILNAFDPRDIQKSREYLERLYPDAEVPPDLGTCGNVLSIGATAMMLACNMVWHLIRAYPANERPQVSYEEMSFNASDLDVHCKGMIESDRAAAA